MTFYNKILDIYKNLACDFCEPDFAEYNKLTGLSKEDWLDNQRSIQFLEDYAYTNKPRPKEWDLLKGKVFNAHINNKEFLYPTKIFNNGYIVSCKRSGNLFDNKGFEALMSSMTNLGEECMYLEKVKEDYETQSLCFSFPTSIKWNDIVSGGYIASFLIDYPHGFFFLFGPSAKWGLFVANDAEVDVELLGIKKEISNCFAPYYQYESSF